MSLRLVELGHAVDDLLVQLLRITAVDDSPEGLVEFLRAVLFGVDLAVVARLIVYICPAKKGM